MVLPPPPLIKFGQSIESPSDMSIEKILAVQHPSPQTNNYRESETPFHTLVGSPAELDDVGPPVIPSDVPMLNLQPIIATREEDEATIEPQVGSPIETQKESVDAGMKEADAHTIETNLASEPLGEPSMEPSFKSNSMANVEPLEEPPIEVSVEIGDGVENRESEEHVTMDELKKQKGDEMEQKLPPIKVTPKLIKDIQKIIQELTDKEKRYTTKISQLEAQCEEDSGSH
ncbi:hypothetical protein Pfo_010139 [Paulownia fortunei]|nr:hypothetical protein Pfo_010139 [Paulownia fortunei]